MKLTPKVVATIGNPNHVNYLVELPFNSWEESQRWLIGLSTQEQIENAELTWYEIVVD